MSRRAQAFLATLYAATIAAALAGCATTKPAGNSLAGESLPDEMITKPGEDPTTLTDWQRSTRKFNYRLKKMFGAEPNEAAAQDLFAKGDQSFKEKKYDQAAKQFKKAAKRWPDSPLEEDALYMQAESQFFAERYSKASDTYDNMMKKFENSRYLERAVARQFSIARYWEEIDRRGHRWLLIPNLIDKTQPLFDTPGNAIAAYTSVHLNDPTGPLADDSIMATANMHFLAERYEDADYYYGLIRSQYPESEHQEVAHLLDLRAKMRKYQGPYYDGAPLEEASDLIQQVSVQFPSQPADEKERLRNAARAIRDSTAQRDWEIAEYYARTKRYGGARYYYQQVIKDYDDTPYAEMAQKRLAEFAGRPDNPPDRFRWLVDFFNGRKREED